MQKEKNSSLKHNKESRYRPLNVQGFTIWYRFGISDQWRSDKLFSKWKQYASFGEKKLDPYF